MEVRSNGKEESGQEEGSEKESHKEESCEEGQKESCKEENRQEKGGQEEEIGTWLQRIHERAIAYRWPSCFLEFFSI
jgi:hypothetical protein